MRLFLIAALPAAFDYVLKPFDLNPMEASIVACLSHADYHKRLWWKRLTCRSA